MFRSIRRLFVDSNQTKRLSYLSLVYIILGVLGFGMSYFIGKITQSTISSDIQTVIRDVLILTVVSVIYMIVAWYIKVSIIKVKQTMMSFFRTKTANSLISIDYETTHSLEQGDIIGRLSNDTSSIATAASLVLEILKSAVFLCVIGVGMLFLDIKLAISFIVVLPIVFLAQYFSSAGTIKHIIPWKTAIGKTDALAQDLLNNRTTIKSYNLYETALSWLSNSLNDVAHKGIKGLGRLFLYGSIVAIINFLPTFVVGLYGLSLLQNGYVNVGTLISAIMLANYASEETQNLQNALQNVPQLLASSQRIFPIWDSSEEQSGKAAYNSDDMSISFKNVSFCYPKNPDINILNSISFEIAKGEKVGIVGTSGSGKSTLVKLLTKFYSEYSGNIEVLGGDLTSWKNDELRTKLGVISQNFYLFDTTIKENLLYANKNASDEELRDVISRAQLSSFVDEHGLDYVIGEQGRKLSGGQRQRLCIARALLQGSEILLLDEATSALDNKTESEVQQILNNLENQTQIVIAHRLSTITTMDRIIVLDQGNIVEEGTHAELLDKNGVYASLYKREEQENER